MSDSIIGSTRRPAIAGDGNGRRARMSYLGVAPLQLRDELLD